MSDKYLIKYLETRALRSLGLEAVNLMTDKIIFDPYREYSPQDSAQWVELLMLARQRKQELYERLFYLRGVGTILTKSDKFGYALKPVIGPDGWSNIETYDKEKQCLNGFATQLIQFFRILAAKEEGK